MLPVDSELLECFVGECVKREEEEEREGEEAAVLKNSVTPLAQSLDAK